ncbi:MAG: sigma-70 family RNA polymerase sigma factor [Planctomycetaceae bacterium]|nr:sigma-70 family RNA polymerase sigma factor [Planctomycetaceae bacterium]
MALTSITPEEEQSLAISDARLVEETKAGDKQAFGSLVLRYEKRLYRVIYRFVREELLAEDLTQETFLRVYENLGQFDLSRRFGPWLFRIGVNLTLDYLRKRKRRGWTAVFSDVSPERPMNPGVSDPRDGIDLQEEVHRVMSEIPEKYRIILVLRELEHFSTAEIAAIVNRKETTVRWRLAEARNRFKSLWMLRMGESPPWHNETASDKTAESEQDDVRSGYDV